MKTTDKLRERTLVALAKVERIRRVEHAVADLLLRSASTLERIGLLDTVHQLLRDIQEQGTAEAEPVAMWIGATDVGLVYRTSGELLAREVTR